MDSSHTRTPSRRGRVVAVVVALLLGIGAATWFGWARDHYIPRNFGIVSEGKVYRSAALTPAALKRVHERYGIKTIVDLGGFDKDPAGDRVETRAAAALGMDRYVFLLEGDGTGNPNAYVSALRIMTDPARQPVLVHCSSGAQRTSGAVMLYRELAEHKPIDQTYPESREYRHDPARNPKLLPFVKQHEPEIRSAVSSGQAIPGYPELPLDCCKP